MSQKSKTSTLVDLSPSEVRHLLRPREGFTPYAKQMFDLYEKSTGPLRVKGLDLSEVRAELELIDELKAELSATQRKLDQQRETLLLYQSNTFRAALLIYRRAQSAAATDGDMAHAIAGFSSFLKKRAVSRKGAPTVLATTQNP